MDVKFENLIVANGTFKQDTKIATVTVPTGGLKRGQALSLKAGKYIVGNATDLPTVILAEDVINDEAPKDIKSVVFTAGTFNSLGVVFGTGQTLENTEALFHTNSIKIVKGIA